MTAKPRGAPGSERRRGLLYGRRKGPRLSGRRKHLLETLLPQLRLQLRPGADPRSYFSSAVSDVWLEIGFGGGEHLLWQVQHRPTVGIIGAEPYEAGVAKLLSKVSSVSSANIRIYEGDARDVVEALPDAGLDRVFVLFPDPWPKKRHHKRRLIQMATLDTFGRTMKSGAELKFATDDGGYASWALERFIAHPAFEWGAARAADWKTRPADWPPTRYEEKALEGPPLYLRFLRRGR